MRPSGQHVPAGENQLLILRPDRRTRCHTAQMTTFSHRMLAPALAAAALVLLLGGCAGSGGTTVGSPLPTPSAATPTPTITVTVTAAPEAPASRAPATSPPESIRRCQGSDLAMEYRADPEASGAGSSAFDLVLTNTASVACALAGIPGVYATDADGTRISAVADASGPNPDEPIDLLPGARADVRVAWHSPDADGCPVGTSSYLVAEVVDAADGAIRAPAELKVCTDGTVMMDASAYTLL